MNILTSQTRLPAKASTRRLLGRISSAGAVVAVVAAAVSLPVIAPETTDGASSVVAIARADCPPDCGPGGGGNPSGPPGGGTEFIPPSMPALPSYEPGRGQPALDQNNGVSIYNSAAPQPSQAAQPSQQPVQNQDGSYNRAANGEQQPINYNNAPDNQQLNNDWQKLSDQLNQSPDQNQPGQQKPTQNNDQSQNNQQDKKQTCESVHQSLMSQGPVMPNPDDVEKAQQDIDEEVLQAAQQQPNSPSWSDTFRAGLGTPYEYALRTMERQRYSDALDDAGLTSGECDTARLSSGHGERQDKPATPLHEDSMIPRGNSRVDRGNAFDDCISTSLKSAPLDPVSPAVGTVKMRYNPTTQQVEYEVLTFVPGTGAVTTGVLKWYDNAPDGHKLTLHIEHRPVHPVSPGQPPMRGVEFFDGIVKFSLCPTNYQGISTTDAIYRLKQIDAGRVHPINPTGSGAPGSPNPRTVAGDKDFENWSRQLPVTSNGVPISYTEWDIANNTGGGRGLMRLVLGSDGSAYYTPDHYLSFVRLR
ncbi:ribonuclease domain-containing protein [Mycobacteroides chelonae]